MHLQYATTLLLQNDVPHEVRGPPETISTPAANTPSGVADITCNITGNISPLTDATVGTSSNGSASVLPCTTKRHHEPAALKTLDFVCK